MNTASIKSILSPTVYEQLRCYLQRTIPGGPENSPMFGAVDDALVDQFVIMLWKDHKAAFAGVGIPAPPPGFLDAMTRAVPETIPEASPFAGDEPDEDPEALPRYYVVNSRHNRHGVSDFVGVLPMVRISLPHDGDSYRISTAIGDVLASDHLLRNQREVVAKAYPCERVELVTPARRENVRFAAIAIYLAYQKAGDKLPSYYILEAGLAQGGPRMTYIAKDMQPIVRRSDYEPTQFSSANNYYRGALTLRGDDPLSLTIESLTSDPRKNPAEKPYITITSAFVRTNAYDRRLEMRPAQIYREAVIRVAAIAEALGKRVDDLSILQGLFATDGRRLDWLSVPPKRAS